MRQGELIEATLSYYQQSCVLAVSTVPSSSQYHHHQYHQVGCIITCETMNQVEATVNHVCFMLVDVFESSEEAGEREKEGPSEGNAEEDII